jgi:hypothetical protein
MGAPEFQDESAFDDERPERPLILGVAWDFPQHVIRTASDLAEGLKVHLICAFVDPSSYLTEWEPSWSEAVSLEPALNTEAQYPSAHLRHRLANILGEPGQQWSFRLLNGDVPQALGRLAASTGASLIVLGGPRPGCMARMERIVEGSVSACLIRAQRWPVLVVPQHLNTQ